MKRISTGFMARWLLGAVFTLGGVGAQAAIVGVPGEALLVPLAVFTVDDGDNNTFVHVTAPAQAGTDTVITGYTTPNVSSGGGYVFPGASNTVHWYFYGSDGTFENGASGSFVLGPDETYVFDWRAEAIAKGLGGVLDAQPGYLVFANQSARGGSAATFAIEAQAYLTTQDSTGAKDLLYSFGNAQIPVVALSDGPDEGASLPVIGNEVLYGGGNVPSKVSPIVGGFRLSSSKSTRVGLPLLVAKGDYSGKTRRGTTLMVLWLDQPGPAAHGVKVRDSLGNSCDATLNLSKGLNTLYVFEQAGVIKVNDHPFVYLSPSERAALPELCYSANPDDGADLDNDGSFSPFENIPGFVEIGLPQGSGGQPTGVAFSVFFPDDGPVDGALPVEAVGSVTVMGKDRGKF